MCAFRPAVTKRVAPSAISAAATRRASMTAKYQRKLQSVKPV